jgi:hypothetical protein
LMAVPAQAQTRTYVASSGDDGFPCSRSAPCRTFGGAISKTAAGGVISCLDVSGYGSVNIFKSITIDCAGLPGGGLGTTTGASINGAGIEVVLRGLTFYGAGGGTVGINFSNGASLHIEDSAVTGYSTGLSFQPPAGVTAKLTITNSSISDNNGFGLIIAPFGTAKVTLDRLRSDHNNGGIYAAAIGGGRGYIAIKNSSLSANTNGGLAVDGSAGPLQMVLDNTIVSGNGTYGLLSTGASAQVFVCCSTFTGNDIGWSNSNGGSIYTFGNNNNFANVTANGVANPVNQD